MASWPQEGRLKIAQSINIYIYIGVMEGGGEGGKGRGEGGRGRGEGGRGRGKGGRGGGEKASFKY